MDERTFEQDEADMTIERAQELTEAAAQICEAVNWHRLSAIESLMQNQSLSRRAAESLVSDAFQGRALSRDD